MSRLPKLRDDLAHLKAYRPPREPDAVLLHANESAEPNPAGHWLTPEELDGLLLNRYPPASQLADLLAARWDVKAEQLVFGNGSNDVLLSTFLAFAGAGRTVLVFEPTYTLFARFAVLAGSTVAHEAIGLPFEITRERALDSIERSKASVVVFCTPNNPTGNEVPEGVILAAAERFPETLILVDEAYAEFVEASYAKHIARHRNIVVSRTFSKARGAAGLRFGVLIADPEIAGLMHAIQLPYKISALTLAVAERMAREDEYVADRARALAAECDRVSAALRRVPTLEVFPSRTNFIMFRLKEGEASAVHRGFLSQGLLIRDLSEWAGCKGCLRMSVGTKAENDRFIAAIDKVFGLVTR